MSNITNSPTSCIIFVTTDLRAFKDKSSCIKSFWIKGWGNRNINDDKCAKMPIFSYIRKLNKCVCILLIQIHYLQWMYGTHSQFGFCSSYYVTKIGQFHVSKFWSTTRSVSAFVVLALCSNEAPRHFFSRKVDMETTTKTVKIQWRHFKIWSKLAQTPLGEKIIKFDWKMGLVIQGEIIKK